MVSLSDKIVINTLQELKYKRHWGMALGHDVVMCRRCADKGTYETRDIYDSDIWNCEMCVIGWIRIWTEWVEKLNRGWWSRASQKCVEHTDYIGSERPTVLCDACWKIWFEAPRKPKGLVQNIE